LANQAEPEYTLGETLFSYPVRLRVDNPEYIEAWRFLYGYKYHDMKLEHTQEALKTNYFLCAKKGEDWKQDVFGRKMSWIYPSPYGSIIVGSWCSNKVDNFLKVCKNHNEFINYIVRVSGSF